MRWSACLSSARRALNLPQHFPFRTLTIWTRRHSRRRHRELIGDAIDEIGREGVISVAESNMTSSTGVGASGTIGAWAPSMGFFAISSSRISHLKKLLECAEIG